MNTIDNEIKNIDQVICKNISIFDDSDRGLLAQNILAQLRNLVEHIFLKVFSNGKDIDNTYENIKKAENYIKTRGDLRFLSKFHGLLQKTASHYTVDEENSERLILKYYEYLLKTKLYLKANFNLDILENIDEFPLNTDSVLSEYYEKIAEKIDSVSSDRIRNKNFDRFYIRKIKPFFVKHKIYYEVTFTRANDKESKFDRIIAFTKLDISQNYAVKLNVSSDKITTIGKSMPIQVIENWEVSIRPCEIKNFAAIFGEQIDVHGGQAEYKNLMKILTKTELSLVELMDFEDRYYIDFRNNLVGGSSAPILDILDKCRDLIEKGAPGSTLIRYLLHKLNNKVIKLQYKYGEGCERLSGLFVEYGCRPFDQMPFNTSLIGHNPRTHDLFECLDPNNRIHELFARSVKNSTEIKGQLYTPTKEMERFDEIDGLMCKYNSTLYYRHVGRRLEKYKDHIFIKSYEEDSVYIIQKLKELSSGGISNYTNSVNSWLRTSSYSIDSQEKKEALTKMFEASKVALIYGSAGTGKSTMINHVSNFFNEKDKLYLAHTNPAVDNLRRRVNASNCTFKTISKFLMEKNHRTEYDVLYIDECSTVSNTDMRKILDKASFKLLVLVGDTFQIESITFGNWFSLIRSFVPSSSVFELIRPYRSTNQKLLELWNKVRNIEPNILEHITRNGYSLTLNKSLFDHAGEDEIILCLNYDGLYGINNINKFLQSSSLGMSVQWGIQTYKVNDPILFNESNRFSPIIYNNLKGKIVGIEVLKDQIQFDVEIDKTLNELDSQGKEFELIGVGNGDRSVIRFSVNKYPSTDEDDDDLSSSAIVPFQVAYAVSIHKAQGLEYSSVKVVITNEVEELISHNIFYTAITRAKENLKIYWTPETENKILSGLEERSSCKDSALLAQKFSLKRIL